MDVLLVFVYLFSGTFQSSGVIQQAYNLNCPLIQAPGVFTSSPPTRSFFNVDNPQVILETVKKVNWIIFLGTEMFVSISKTYFYWVRDLIFMTNWLVCKLMGGLWKILLNYFKFNIFFNVLRKELFTYNIFNSMWILSKSKCSCICGLLLENTRHERFWLPEIPKGWRNLWYDNLGHAIIDKIQNMLSF